MTCIAKLDDYRVFFVLFFFWMMILFLFHNFSFCWVVPDRVSMKELLHLSSRLKWIIEGQIIQQQNLRNRELPNLRVFFFFFFLKYNGVSIFRKYGNISRPQVCRIKFGGVALSILSLDLI